MSLLSDRQIKARCIKPDYFLIQPEGGITPVIQGVTHSKEQVANWVARSYSRLIVVKGDAHLEELGWKPMISPFIPEPVRYKGDVKIISKGLSHYGYDVSLSAEDLKLFTNINSTIVDPMRMNESHYVAPKVHYDEEFDLHYVIQPPKSVLLGHTPEYFHIPRDILVTCLGKSTYARVGLAPIVTPLEPEWEGNLVLEMANLIELPIRVYLDCGVAQLNFNQGSEPCEVSYKDKGGKYQGQRKTQNAMV